jgi:hypothetical protein
VESPGYRHQGDGNTPFLSEPSFGWGRTVFQLEVLGFCVKDDPPRLTPKTAALTLLRIGSVLEMHEHGEIEERPVLWLGYDRSIPNPRNLFTKLEVDPKRKKKKKI